MEFAVALIFIILIMIAAYIYADITSDDCDDLDD